MIKCPDCYSERNTPSASGKRLICLNCYYSFTNPDAPKNHYFASKMRRPAKPKRLTYLQLQEENTQLKAELNRLKLGIYHG